MRTWGTRYFVFNSVLTVLVLAIGIVLMVLHEWFGAALAVLALLVGARLVVQARAARVERTPTTTEP